MNILVLDDEPEALKLLVNAVRAAEPEAEVYAFGKVHEALP